MEEEEEEEERAESIMVRRRVGGVERDREGGRERHVTHPSVMNMTAAVM